MANGEVLEMMLEDMRCEKANIEKSLIDRAHYEFQWLRAQFEAEKAEIRRFHQLELKQTSHDRVSSRKEIEALNAQLRFSIRRIIDLSLSQNELKRVHELELKEKSDEIEGI